MSYQPEPKPGAYQQPYGAHPYAPPQLDPQQQAAMQYHTDGEHLQILSILHYVMGGFATLGACIPGIYLMIGLGMLGGAAVADSDEAGAGLAIIGGAFSLFALAIMSIFALQALCMFLAARWLGTARNRMFCFINACVMCLHAPFGTALGIFTIIVLSRPSVVARFEANQYGYFHPPQDPFKRY
jgi:hypothetical protein